MRACRSLVVVVLVLAASAVSAETKPDWMGKIRSGHPRIFFNRDTWPKLRAAAEGPAREDLRKLLLQCDGYPTNPVCSGTEMPVDPPGQIVSWVHTGIPNIREWGNEAAQCALAWRFTGKAEYLAKARAMIKANVKGYNEAYENRRAINWYAQTRINTLAAYDWIYEALTPTERRELIVPLLEILNKFLDKKGRPRIRRLNDDALTPGSYGEPTIDIYAGLAAYGDGDADALAEKLLKSGHATYQRLLAPFWDGKGGERCLGSATPGYSLGSVPHCFFNFLHAWLAATGENLAERLPGYMNMPAWTWWLWIPDPDKPSLPFFPGCGDDQHVENRLRTAGLAVHLRQYIHFYRELDPKGARLAATLLGLCPKSDPAAFGWPAIPFLLAADEPVEPYPVEELANASELARHFGNFGHVFMRSGWRTDSTYALFTAGSDGRDCHKQYDEGSFVIYKHDFLALDSGSRAQQRDYNLKYYYGQSVAHNVVLIEKPGEKLPGHWGPEYDGPEGRTNFGGMYGRSAKFLGFTTNANWSYAAADLTSLYGEKCRENIRQFVHVQPDYFVVYDRVTAAEAGYRKDWLLHVQNEPVVEGRVARADSRGGRLFSETLLPADAVVEKVGGPGREFWANGRNWELEAPWRERTEKACAKSGRGPYWGEWRLETHPGAPRAEDRFLHVLTATGTNALAGVKTRLVREADRDGVTLFVPATRAGESVTREVTVLFNRTGEVGCDVRNLTFVPER